MYLLSGIYNPRVGVLYTVFLHLRSLCCVKKKIGLLPASRGFLL
jgi:hypothetical protein